MQHAVGDPIDCVQVASAKVGDQEVQLCTLSDNRMIAHSNRDALLTIDAACQMRCTRLQGPSIQKPPSAD